MSKKGLYCVLGTIVFLQPKKDTHSKSTLLFLDKFPLSSHSPLKLLHLPLFSIFYLQMIKYTTMKQSWIKKAYTAFWKTLPFNSQKGYSLNEYPFLLSERVPPIPFITLSNPSNFDFKTFISIWRKS